MRNLILIFVTILLLSSCGEEPHKIPDPPNMGSEIEAYKNPTAVLNKDNMKEVSENLLNGTLEFLEKTDALSFIISGLFGKKKASSQSPFLATNSEGPALEGNGHLKITRICDGHNAKPIADPNNGNMVINAILDNNSLSETIWGEISKCKFLAGENKVKTLINGSINIYSSKAFQSGSDLLFNLWGEFNTEKSNIKEFLSFRLDGKDNFEIKIPHKGRNFVGWVSLSKKSSYGIRAFIGTFNCDFDKKVCQNVADVQDQIKW